MTKKEFVLQQIAPYWKDPSTCGHDGICCQYITQDGKMCVAGKNMIDPKRFYKFGTISHILDDHTQKEVFKRESVDQLSQQEWLFLQQAHDKLAYHQKETALDMLQRIDNTITQKELDNYETTT